MAMTRLTGTMISRALPANLALNSMKSLPSFSELVASKLMFSTISPFFTYSRGTCTVSSTSTATYGVKPLSVHHSYRARIRYGRVEVDSRAFIASATADPASLTLQPPPGRPKAADAPLGGSAEAEGGKRGGTIYLRMTFSDGVSASIYAGREKIRSAYFSS